MPSRSCEFYFVLPFKKQSKTKLRKAALVLIYILITGLIALATTFAMGGWWDSFSINH